MLAALVSRVMGRARPTYADGSFAVVGNPRGDLSVAEGLPLKTEIVRQGGSWTAVIPTASAFTYPNAWPTTTGQIVLYNGDSQNSYVIDSAFVASITSAAAAESVALLAQIVKPTAIGTVPTSGVTPFSRSGRNAYGGAGIVALNNTAMGQLANLWELLASPQTTGNTTTIGQGVYADLYGGWIVPPKGGLALTAVSSTAAGTAVLGVTWHEIVLPVLN